MGFDYVFEMSGSTKAAEQCPQIISKCGSIIYFAVYPMDYTLPLNLFDMYGKEARLQFVFTDPFVYPNSVDLLSRLDTDKLIGQSTILRTHPKRLKISKTLNIRSF